jgi:hypothetical protein
MKTFVITYIHGFARCHKDQPLDDQHSNKNRKHPKTKGTGPSFVKTETVGHTVLQRFATAQNYLLLFSVFSFNLI